MIVKKNDFISLVPKKETKADHLDSPMAKTAQSKPEGPYLYVHGIKLSIPDDSLGQELRAEIKFEPKRISKNIVNGNETLSYDLEITEIKFLPF